MTEVKKSFSIVCEVLGEVFKRGTTNVDHTVTSRGVLLSPLDRDHVFRIAREVDILTSANLVIQQQDQKSVSKFRIVVTNDKISTKYRGKSIEKNRSKTIVKATKQIDIGVDLHSFITYLLSELNIVVARKSTKKVVSEKHQSLLDKKAQARALLASINADIKNETSSKKSIKKVARKTTKKATS